MLRLNNYLANYNHKNMIIAPTLTLEGVNMSKSQDQKKETKKKPAKSLKEKRAEKKEKKK